MRLSQGDTLMLTSLLLLTSPTRPNRLVSIDLIHVLFMDMILLDMAILMEYNYLSVDQ